MVLDLRTIYVVSALTLLVLGSVHLATFATGRFGRWPAWWGASYMVLGTGTVLVCLRDIVPYSVSIQAGNVLTIAGYLLSFFAIRVLADRPVSYRSCLLTIVCLSLPVLVLPTGAVAVSARLFYISAVCCLCDLAVLREGIGIYRRERLFSAGLLAWLYLPTAALFLVRAVMAATGEIGGPDPYGTTMVHSWMASTGVIFLALRSMLIVLMAAERSRGELVAQAHHDPLTGALNRGGLAQRLPLRDAQSVALLIVDIDHFKQLNDQFGHAAGDVVLKLFATAARGVLRPDDLLSRHGGDEFIVLLKDVSEDGAIAVAERMRAAFADIVSRHQGPDVAPTLSIGVAIGGSASADFEMLLARADAALYASKRMGRDRVEASADREQAA
jgi:diguanylate cyclase (GGDEF)-like protein